MKSPASTSIRIRMLLSSESEAGSMAATVKLLSTGSEIDVEATFAEELRLACRLPVNNLVGYSGEPLGLTDIDIDQMIEREISRCRRLFEKQLPMHPVRWASMTAQNGDGRSESESIEIVAVASKSTLAGRTATKALEDALAAGKAVLAIPRDLRALRTNVTLLTSGERPSQRALELGRRLSDQAQNELEWRPAHASSVISTLISGGNDGLLIIELASGELGGETIDRILTSAKSPVLLLARE
ncbi:MAG: hypothetical protein AB3N20_00820 [Rhizobiaceae bacterium]